MRSRTPGSRPPAVAPRRRTPLAKAPVIRPAKPLAKALPKPIARVNGSPRSGGAAVPRKPSPHGLRLAAIDMGTNSVHMVVVEVTDQLGFRILSSEKELTQLGSAALVKHRLTQRAMAHTLEVLARYQRMARTLECDEILCYATSAVRESANGGDFVDAAKTQLGLNVQVISSQEEARLIYLAVRQAVNLDDQPALIVDIGGGSAEFIVGNASRALMLESRKLGASRLTQQCVTTDPVSAKELSGLEKHIRKTLKAVVTRVRNLNVRRVIGTSGTIENLMAVCHAQQGEEEQRSRLLTSMGREEFTAAYRKMVRMTTAERRQLPGLDPGRADQIVAGATLVDFLFRRLKVDAIEVCGRAMREGMIIDYMQTHWPKVRLSVQIREPRRRSVVELGRRCNYDEQHAGKVAELALSLFDQLHPLHQLGPRERELLEFAAMLHDVGWHIGHSGHHKHSYYLIKNGDLEGFSPLELDLIANVARYHRKSFPKKSHDAFMSLDPTDREIVCKLASLLRIAGGLDRGHYGNTLRVKTINRPDTVSFRLLVSTDAELELWACRQKADMFEQVFHKKAIFSAEKARAQ